MHCITVCVLYHKKMIIIINKTLIIIITHPMNNTHCSLVRGQIKAKESAIYAILHCGQSQLQLYSSACKPVPIDQSSESTCSV